MSERIAGRIFASGIVVGDDHQVGEPARNPAHLRPLALVTVASGSEQRDQSTLDVRPKRCNRSLERVGRMRIVDVHRDPIAADHCALEPAADGRDALHRGKGCIPFAAGRQHQRGRGEDVCRLVSTDQWKRETMRLSAMLDPERLTEGRRALLDQLNSLARSADTQNVVAALPRPHCNLVRLTIVGPDYNRLSGLQKIFEQSHLGFEIGLHRLVIIEMVAAEICECRSRERHAFGAMLVKSMARRLIGDMADSHALETGHIVEKGDDVRRRQTGRNLLVKGGHPQGSNRRRAMPRHAPDLARHFDGRGLAIGSGDRDDCVGERSVETRSELREPLTRLGIGNQRNSGNLGPGPSNHCNRTAIDGLRNEILAVEHRSLERTEYAARRDLAMIDRKTGHFCTGIDIGDVAQFHAGQSFLAFALASCT